MSWAAAIGGFCFLCFLGTALFAQTSKCDRVAATLSIRGLAIGMTEAEVTKRFPKLEIYRRDDGLGISTSTHNRQSHIAEIYGEEVSRGLAQIHIGFLDKKVARLHFTYDGFTEWRSSDEFVDAVAKGLNLPGASSWIGKSSSRELVCNDFTITARFTDKIGQYELQSQELLVVRNDYKAELERREKDRVEHQKRVFKP